MEDNDAKRGNEDMVSDFDLMLAKKKEEMSSKRKKKKDVEFINDIDDSIAKMIRYVTLLLWLSLLLVLLLMLLMLSGCCCFGCLRGLLWW